LVSSLTNIVKLTESKILKALQNCCNSVESRIRVSVSIKQIRNYGAGTGAAQVSVGQIRHLAAARGTFEKSLLDQERLIYLLYGAGILAQGCRNSSQSHRPSVELIYYCTENAVVYLVKPVLVYVQSLKRQFGNVKSNSSGTLYLRKVTHAAKQGIGNSGCSPAAAGYRQQHPHRMEQTKYLPNVVRFFLV